MATRTLRVSDLSNDELSEDTTSTTLSVTDGRETFTVEIDLSDGEFAALVKAVKRYREAGRVKAPKSPRRSSTDHESDASAVRTWARENGHTVNERGALPRSVVEAYDAAHGNTTPDVDA